MNSRSRWFPWFSFLAIAGLVLLPGMISGCGGGASMTSTADDSRNAFRSVVNSILFDGRYDSTPSQVIRSPAELDRFIGSVYTGQEGSSESNAQNDPLLTAIRQANVDFQTEALVLLKYRSPGGEQIVLDPPTVANRTFFSTIRISHPLNGGGGAAITLHFFVYAVSKASVDAVRVPVVLTDESGTQTPNTIRLTVAD